MVSVRAPLVILVLLLAMLPQPVQQEAAAEGGAATTGDVLLLVEGALIPPDSLETAIDDNAATITIRSSSGFDSTILVSAEWVSRFQYPSSDHRFMNFDWSGQPWLKFEHVDTTEAVTLQVHEFVPDFLPQWTYGSPSTIMLEERPMRISVTSHNEQTLALDFYDGSSYGQKVSISSSWLESLGFSRPGFTTSDHLPINSFHMDGRWLLDVPHFSPIYVKVDGTTMGVLRYLKEVEVGEPVQIEWYTDGGTNILHSEVHWGTSSALLTNTVSGSPLPPIDLGEEDGPYRPNNTSYAVLGPFSSPGTIYYEVHSIVDALSLTTHKIRLDIIPENTIPAPPVAVYPLPGAIAPTNITLEWDVTDLDGDFLNYTLMFGKDQHPHPYTDESSSSPSFPLPHLQSNTTYYWKVFVADSDGNEVMGPLWNFTTQHNPLAPYATFSIDVDDQNLTVSADASNSSAPGGHALNFTWSFGDGSTAYGPLTTHTYSARDDYTINLTVIGQPGGLNSTASLCVPLLASICIDEQDDAGSGGDADSRCSSATVLNQGKQGTPGAYQGTLNGLDGDFADCFKFEIGVTEGATTVYFRTDAPSDVDFVLTRASTTIRIWSGDTVGFQTASAGSSNPWKLHVSSDKNVGIAAYSFDIASDRDYDKDDEIYKGTSYNDHQERFSPGGMNFNNKDSDGDTLNDGWELYGGTDATFVNNLDGDANDVDGITLGKEHYWSTCDGEGADRLQFDLFIEVDAGGGSHVEDGSSEDPHNEVMRSAAFAKAFQDTAATQGTRSLTKANVVWASTGTDRCGGSQVTASHHKYVGDNDLLNAYNGRMVDEKKGYWHYIFIGHYEDNYKNVIGFSRGIPSAMLALLNQAMEDASATTSNWDSLYCHEVGHNLELHHPETTDKSLSCMVKGLSSNAKYGTYNQARACRSSIIDTFAGAEWPYVYHHLYSSPSDTDGAVCAARP